ncbi:centromere-associated protein E isoform X1 [Bombyx mori]|uniref:Uncharacterized protein n=1 Tax=Bombyx mori TaxID=7091 RepID=A0A8R2QWQ3_BOMMO|nr:centromere-associated protein E [Bombyx mori]XP_037870713.1 centromere-associated protein E [Bombyx mori]
MSNTKNIDHPSEMELSEETTARLPSSEVSSVAGSVKTTSTTPQFTSSSERQIKFERAQKCLENAALVSKRIKEHRKATAELLGRPFEDDDCADTSSEMASTMSERTGFSTATDTSTTLSVQDALNIPGISESLANTLKQKEILMEKIKQYKELSKRSSTTIVRKESITSTKTDSKKSTQLGDVTHLSNTIKEKDNALSVLQVKMKIMETTILDLQEKINEKDQIIEAKNKATTLMSDTLSKKDKDSLALLEDTKQQMTKMQENFIAMEAEWKDEKQRLLKDIESKDVRISSLEEANKLLEAARFEISLEHSKLAQELEQKNKEITEFEEKIKELAKQSIEPSCEEKTEIEEKGSLEIANMTELTKKIELLEHLNCQIRQTNKELENKLATMGTESKAVSSPSKKGSPLISRKSGRNTASKMKSPWSQLSSETLNQDTDKKINKNEIAKLEMVIQSLNKDLVDKEYVISEKDTLLAEKEKLLAGKDTLIAQLQLEHQQHMEGPSLIHVGTNTEDVNEIAKVQEQLKQELNDEIKDVNVKDLIEKLKSAEEQITQLNDEIDAANKNMIKVKSNHKLKLKQMQKTIDNFSKVSDSNKEIVRLTEELHHLSQKVAELEEEKGNLQLHLVDYDSGRMIESDVYKKMIEMENLAETRLKAISLLESQKFDLVQELHILQQKYDEVEDKLADISQLQSDQVCSEIKSVHLEEQIDALSASKKELALVIENLKLDKEQLYGTIKDLENDKEDIMNKLQNYIQENMDLTDKLEKMSAEKVSSAESIEIVESLTTQEKLELEEYNKALSKDDECDRENISPTNETNIDCLIEQSTDLNKKIDLLTHERDEIFAKINKLNVENETLHQTISDLSNKCAGLQTNIETLNNEKSKLEELNHELTRQIEELKHERIEIVKETAEFTKPLNTEEATEASQLESQPDEKSIGEKGLNRTKSVKQLTKEILKLKNTIKEREDEIADCQMKILSLEEHQQKQNELLHSNSRLENKLRSLQEENQHLKQEIETINKNQESEQQLLQYKEAHDSLQQEVQKLHRDYSNAINARDTRINELETVLVEYEKQIYSIGNTLQQKDKELNEYINQVTKLNDVSQKLKSTIELLEEEKAKDQNADVIKSLNKQIAVLQKKLVEFEDKVRILEEEKGQVMTLKNVLENTNISLESELKKLQELYAEKQILIKELQAQQNMHSEEMTALVNQNKERDEEIHEIKLQLRKESIENEKLRNSLGSKEQYAKDIMRTLEETNHKVNELTTEKQNLSQELLVLESKNKEIMEKLKKFAVTIKKKSAMYVELENTLHETQKQLQEKNEQLENVFVQVDTLSLLRDKLKHAEEEIDHLHSIKASLDQQQSNNIQQLQNKILKSEEKLKQSSEEILSSSEKIATLQEQIASSSHENSILRTQIENLNKKLVEHEIEQKNNTNYTTKIATLEADINQKNNQISELLAKINHEEQSKIQTQFGIDAKIQERDLYIENIESELSKYKSRICRLEESIAVMEDRRYSLERKADQLGSYLQEKQKAYSEYTIQEDELVNRLAVLMDHDRVVEKQLLEIEHENKELQKKNQILLEENQNLQISLSDMQQHYNALVEKANRTDLAESESTKYQTQLRDLESNLKRITHEHQTLIVQKKKEIEDLEIEFNTQIESAIRDKKVLNEKYEKNIEYVTQLEAQLQEYKNNIENLNMNVEELNKMNLELIDKHVQKQQTQSPDYTEQYINEINKLNALLKQKDEEIIALNQKINNAQVSYMSMVSDYESKLAQFTTKLENMEEEMQRVSKQLLDSKQHNEELQILVREKDDQIKELKETKLTFEMNIPKTEGMIISSTIEPMSDDANNVDISSIESQIISGDSEPPLFKMDAMKKTSEQIQKQSVGKGEYDAISEPVMVAKKAYVCFGNEDVSEQDPFNSDEGWGLGESEEIEDPTPGLSHLNSQIQQLNNKNDDLKDQLNASNNKLIKALKKLKEFKSSNEVLSAELKISKQLSQSTLLDTAIEDELRLNIQDLEKKLEEAHNELKKEKREKESIKKQNEVFNSANERLTDMKEKLDNEIELWKYKFKEANDKLSTVQWEGEPKATSQPSVETTPWSDESKLKEEIVKIEKENEELHSIVEHLTLQNKDLLEKQGKLLVEIQNLKSNLEQVSSSCENCSALKQNILELQLKNSVLEKMNVSLNEKIRDLEINMNEAIEEHKKMKITYETRQEEDLNNKMELEERCYILEEKLKSLELSESEANQKVVNLISELESISKDKNKEQLKVQEEEEFIQERSVLQEQSAKLNTELQECYTKIIQLETLNTELTGHDVVNQEQINQLKSKLEQLNTENDNLLSTVAELRSSISSAVDQRGFEIAELWKQHLAQREADFQKTEHELRVQLSAFESKYEQLLDSVQSSTQEETNKIVTMEQVTSLQNKLQDKEEHLRNLQEKYADVINQIEILRSEIEDEKVAFENKLLEQQEEYEKQIKDLRTENQSYKQMQEQSILNINEENAQLKKSSQEIELQNEQLQLRVNDAEAKVLELTHQLELKDSEIYQKTHEYTITLTQRNDEFENVRQQLVEYEKRIEDLTYEKESELAILRLKMHENANHYETMQKESEIERVKLIEELNVKITESVSLNKQVAELNKALEEEVAKTNEMQTALENQEIEIVTLNDEITNLQNMVRASSSKIQKHVSFASDTKQGRDEQLDNTMNKELLDAVPRAELDLAMYMLHQRDVRCEELTMELTQLLEERDTLQLRLSDSLRSVEEMKSKCKAVGLDESISSIPGTVSELPSFSVEKEQQFVDTHRGQTSRSSSVSDPDGDKPKLQAKLSELRSVKHTRDVRLRHESEQRQLDLRLLQRDVANLPPEAVEQLAQAHHTLSRDTQSTSTVLLNWLRGKSTPKVVHM